MSAHDAASGDERALIEAARVGDPAALQKLWESHHAAARRYANALTRRFDPDDLVSEAFLRVFTTLRNGHGPTDALRPYLFVTVRNVAITWAKTPESRALDEIDEPAYDANIGGALMEGANRDKLREALESLPEQWRQILWATEIEGQRPAQLSERFGLQANSVAALAYRAREALRYAWVQAHVEGDGEAGEHQWVRERVGRYICQALTPRQRERFEEHLDGCRQCADTVREAKHLAVLPIGVSALALLVELGAPTPTASAATLSPAPRGARHVARGARRLATRPATVIATTVAATCVVVASLSALSPTDGHTTFSDPPVAAQQPFVDPTVVEETPPPAPLPDPPPSPSAPAPVETPEEVISAPPSATPAPVDPDLPAPGDSPTVPPPTTTFTLASISAGTTGVAALEIVNAGVDFVQRSDGVAGSSAIFTANDTLTFVPQASIANEYVLRGGARVASAIDITRCTTPPPQRTLRCEIDPAVPNPPTPQQWTWSSGDIRRLHLAVTVSADAEPGTHRGSGSITLRSESGDLVQFASDWQVDVPTRSGPEAPNVESVIPDSTGYTVYGTAKRGQVITVRTGLSVLGDTTPDADGRWTIRLPDGTTGPLYAEAS